jgi:hypothetical protein
LIVCNLTKPESTLDQVKKSFPKLVQTDAALVATALVLSGRYAPAVYDGNTYNWPKDIEPLTKAVMRELAQIELDAEPAPKTRAKAAVEEEAIEVHVGLVPSYNEGERVLGDREDLKQLFADILEAGVEFQYSPTDIGIQWALDRTNWRTLSNGELTKRVRMKAAFEGLNIGTDVGSGAPKRKRATKAAAAPAPEAEAEAE